jgi:hypothetical protein
MSTFGQQTSFKCDLEELVDPPNRAGTAGYKLFHQEVAEKKQAPIEPTMYDPSPHDPVRRARRHYHRATHRRRRSTR